MFCHFTYYCYICSGNQRYSTMARPISDETAHKVTLHINNGYRYATLRPRVTNEATGKRMNKSIHLGTVTESLKFIPGKAYLYMPPAERKQLVFPQGWDLSELDSLPSTRKAGRPTYNGDAPNRLYGDVWLMERVAEKTKIREDLEKVLEGNKEKVDDIMTLVMFPYISSYSYSIADSLAGRDTPRLRPHAKCRQETSPVLRSQSPRKTARPCYVFVRKKLERWNSVLLTPQAGLLTEAAWPTYAGGTTRRTLPWRRRMKL